MGQPFVFNNLSFATSFPPKLSNSISFVIMSLFLSFTFIVALGKKDILNFKHVINPTRTMKWKIRVTHLAPTLVVCQAYSIWTWFGLGF